MPKRNMIHPAPPGRRLPLDELLERMEATEARTRSTLDEAKGAIRELHECFATARDMRSEWQHEVDAAANALRALAEKVGTDAMAAIEQQWRERVAGEVAETSRAVRTVFDELQRRAEAALRRLSERGSAEIEDVIARIQGSFAELTELVDEMRNRAALGLPPRPVTLVGGNLEDDPGGPRETRLGPPEHP